MFSSGFFSSFLSPGPGFLGFPQMSHAFLSVDDLQSQLDWD